MVQIRLLISKTILFASIAFLTFNSAMGQKSLGIKGRLNVAFATVMVKETQQGVNASPDGEFEICCMPEGQYTLRVSAVGYRTTEEKVELSPNKPTDLNLNLTEDILQIETVVVTGSRTAISRKDAVQGVMTIPSKVFDITNSSNLAEGLQFNAGLRVENNCQNCGFNQLRMNGLPGHYSQILIDSRPVFGALTGVYGLEAIPANLIERIEVVKGGGSALYGGNAIAGTVNIITKEPTKNGFSVGSRYTLINGAAADRQILLNGTMVNDSRTAGVTLYGMRKNREAYDHNNDGFTEIPLLEHLSFGANGYVKLGKLSRLNYTYFGAEDYRRGGSELHLLPHQAQVAEGAGHRINGGSINYSIQPNGNFPEINAYIATQHVLRNSYYGAGGMAEVVSDNDSVKIPEPIWNATANYGTSTELNMVGGFQLRKTYKIGETNKIELMAGSEGSYTGVKDNMPGYRRTIDQNVRNYATFAQAELKHSEKFSLLAGARFDNNLIDGKYTFLDQAYQTKTDLPIVSPRLIAKYAPSAFVQIRGGYARGFRGPQAFDEDLHIAVVGGEAQFIKLSPDLKPELSDAYFASLDYEFKVKDQPFLITTELFNTQIQNQFINESANTSGDDVQVLEKRNGYGATARGVNLTGKTAFLEHFNLEAGFTVQEAFNHQSETIWEAEDPEVDNRPAVATDRILRTPNNYGHFTIDYSDEKLWIFALTGNYTGSMEVPHVIEAESQYTIIKNTQSFFDCGVKVGKGFLVRKNVAIEISGGVRNLFNSYQNDFDRGVERDVTYMYGPLQPRTVYIGIKLSSL